MTNKEINEYLAEHLFGFKYFKHCGGYNKPFGECSYQPSKIPDYFSNAMPVLEKLCKMGECERPEVTIYNTIRYGYKVDIVHYVGIRGHEVAATVYADTLHEAICRCAVKYLKGMEE